MLEDEKFDQKDVYANNVWIYRSYMKDGGKGGMVQ